MKLWGTPACTWYSCEDFPSRTTWSRVLVRKEEVRSNIWTEIPQDLSLWRRLICQTLLKTLDISSATAEIVPDPFKDLAILSDTIIRRSAVDVEDPKPYWKSEKKGLISVGDQQADYLEVFQRLYKSQKED